MNVTKPLYFPHVEGLRGVAALYVFFFHLTQVAIGIRSPLHLWLPLAMPLLYGHYAVAVFIVVSGFVLGLPVARNPMRFDAKKFALRRARRIYPAYLTALCLSIPTFYLYALVVLGKHPSLEHVFISFVAHVVLLHNISASTIKYINPPLWSIALECQIYVVFAVVLVPIWRKVGIYALFLAAVGLGLAPHFLLHGYLDWSYPWFLGLFGAGVFAAAVVHNATFPAAPWKLFSSVSAVVALFLVIGNSESTGDVHPPALIGPDVAVGMATAIFLIASCVSASTWMPTRALGWWPVEKVGSFSYSLYLCHIIVVQTVAAILIGANAGLTVWLTTLIIAVPATLGFAYVFYLVAERPFLSVSYRKSIDDALQHGTQTVQYLVPEA